jgi:hypothetical protein
VSAELHERLTVDLLPVELLGVPGVHVINPGELLIHEALDARVDVGLAVQHQRLVEVNVRVGDLFVGRVALQVSGSAVLLDHIHCGVGVNVKTVPTALTHLLDVVAVGQLCLRRLQADFELLVD